MMPKGTQKKDAEEELQSILEQIQTDNYPYKKNSTFSETAKEWLEYKKMNIRTSTWAVYEGQKKLFQ